MSEPIKLYIKQTDVSGPDDDFTLDALEHDNNTLYDASSGPSVALGEGLYEFEIEVYLESPGGEVAYVHTITVSQDDSDTTIKPGVLPKSQSGRLNPSEHHFSQDDSDTTMKPGNLPGGRGLFE